MFLENLFKTQKFPEQKRKRFNSFYVKKPQNFISLDKDIESNLHKDYFNSGMQFYKNKNDDYYKYLKSLETPKNMIQNEKKQKFSKNVNTPQRQNNNMNLLNLSNKQQSPNFFGRGRFINLIT